MNVKMSWKGINPSYRQDFGCLHGNPIALKANFRRVEFFMLKAHEILGTDKPIFKEKEDTYFYLDELLHLNENPEKYSVVGYVQVIKNKEIFFKAVYSLD
jgi:hypothetical protein